MTYVLEREIRVASHWRRGETVLERGRDEVWSLLILVFDLSDFEIK